MMVLYIEMAKKKIYIYLILLATIISVFIACMYFIDYQAEQVMSQQPIYKGPDDKKVVTFTCNVDWGNEYISPMLEIFQRENIKATFFVTGRWADEFPEILKKMYEDGHIIGNHGYYHKDYSKLNYQQNYEQISAAQKSIQRITGIKPVFFAPPSGAYNDYTLNAAKEQGCKVIMWSIDTIDWKRDGVERIIDRAAKRMHNGGIILMHPTNQTIEALPVMIHNIKNAGFEIISLEQLVKLIEIN